ncbi:exodeoxyribonuclease VII large subunit [Candidatus Saccharibacteria bacterium]|nr:exodeoxyribonuclease VII large subunit [Candidatus Saccharibacteria bacterium]
MSWTGSAASSFTSFDALDSEGFPQVASSSHDEAIFSPSEFIAVTNQTLEYAYSSVLIKGEVASFKVNQGKWVFFDIKDEGSSVSCFMTLWSLRVPLEDGMKVVVRGTPKLTKWGKFSVTVNAVKPVGEGSLKKAYEMLKKKLAGEGLFDPTKKRKLPADLIRLGVISSTQAAGYADFIKIINARWGGMKVVVAHTQVQGMDAPDQIIRALKYFNERAEVDAIAILRGGGSADDLSCFNDEALVREIAASRIPIITGIGHEVDESLADLAADARASTPSNAAEMLTRDRAEEREKLVRAMNRAEQVLLQEVERARNVNYEKVENISQGLLSKYVEPMMLSNREKINQCLMKMRNESSKLEMILKHKLELLEALNPEKVLKQGYAILVGKISPGNVVKITTIDKEIEAEVKKIKERN